MDLRYVVSGNMMDIVIKDSNGEVLEKGKEEVLKMMFSNGSL